LLDSARQIEDVARSATDDLVSCLARAEGKTDIFALHGVPVASELEGFRPSCVEDLVSNEALDAVFLHPQRRHWMQEMGEQEQFIRSALDGIDAEDWGRWYRHERRRRDDESRRVTEGVLASVRGAKPWRKPRSKKPGRRALARSVAAMRRFLGESDVKAFLAGDEVVLGGTYFDYVVRRRDDTSLLDHSSDPSSGHIPYNLTVVDKGGVVMAQACVVFDRTPVLDQVVALSLHLRSAEDEEAILKTANLFGVTQAGRTNETLASLNQGVAHLSRTPGIGGGILGDLLTSISPERSIADESRERAAAILPAVMRRLRSVVPVSGECFDVMLAPAISLDEATLVAPGDFATRAALPFLGRKSPAAA
jgi:hypothetical protein